MTGLQLKVGDCWEIAGRRHYLDQVMVGGFLLLKCERTAKPFQVDLDNGEGVLPTEPWLFEQFAAGRARRFDAHSQLPDSRKLRPIGEEDFDSIQRSDPKAIIRQAVLNALDKIPNLKLSDKAIHAALVRIWKQRPIFFEGHDIPGGSTVRGWFKNLGVTGHRPLNAMVSRKGRTARAKRLPIAVHRRMFRFAIAYWSDPSLQKTTAHDRLVKKLQCINKRLARSDLPALPIPGKTTFLDIISKCENYETYSARHGATAANIRYKPNERGLVAERPLQLAAMDHSRADVHVVVEYNGLRLLGRPWITLLIDVHSRCVLGWLVTFEHPSISTVMECLKRANRPKLWMRQRYREYPELAGIYGKPDEIIVDNGWEFTGVSAESALIDVGISIRWAPIYSPTYKAVVERFFLTLNKLFFEKLPGRTFPIAQMREWGLKPSADATITLPQLEDLLDKAIATYHRKRHRMLGDTPLNTWLKGVKDIGVQVIGDDRQLDKMLGREERRRLTRSGISLHGLQYHDPAVTGPLLEKLAPHQPHRDRGKASANPSVKVKYNPANLGEIHVWDPTSRRFETLPCTDPEYANGLSEWHHERIKEWSAETRVASEAEQRAVRLQLADEVDALKPPHARKRVLNTALRLLSSPKVRELAGHHMKVAFGKPTPQGMAPAVPSTLLAEERTDGHAKPVRAQKGGSKRKAKSGQTNHVSSVTAQPDIDQVWEHSDPDATGWEQFR